MKFQSLEDGINEALKQSKDFKTVYAVVISDKSGNESIADNQVFWLVKEAEAFLKRYKQESGLTYEVREFNLYGLGFHLYAEQVNDSGKSKISRLSINKPPHKNWDDVILK